MRSNHFWNNVQKYYKIILSAIFFAVVIACSTTKKVPDGDYLLTKNNFKYEDEKKFFNDELKDRVGQKPNKKQLFVLPLSLWMYNLADPKYDTLLTEYMTYPNEMRNQGLRDSLFVKYNMPEMKGKGLFFDRLMHSWGSAPVILDPTRSEVGAESIEKRLTYRGYWDSKVDYSQKLDSAAKKAEVTYIIRHNEPTIIKDYYYNIPDKNIKAIYEENLNSSLIRSKQILDQTVLEDELARLNALMKSRGYYKFNNSGEEIGFVADTLKSTKDVPLILEIHKDSIDSPYKIATIGNVDVAVVDELKDFPRNTTKDSLRRINFHKVDNRYKTSALWRAILVSPNNVYDQKHLDITKRNILSMNNFSILKARDSLRRGGEGAPNDSIVDVTYVLKPLPKYEFKAALDANYSQLLNWGGGPSIDLTARNVFGGAENLTTNFSGTFGSIADPKGEKKRVFAHEISGQVALHFPRLLVPFNYYKLIPKRYTPTTTIFLGASNQTNIGLGRVNFNTGLVYSATVNDIVNHKLTLFNTQLSLTKNKEKYYDFFKVDGDIRDLMFETYFDTHPDLGLAYHSGQISSDDVSAQIVADEVFRSNLNPEQLNTFNNFFQSLINKDRQTQNVLISSLIYNFSYNEIGKKDYKNPFYFNGKMELAGNIFSLFNSSSSDQGVVSNNQKTIFNIPYSQFAKFDFDVRQYIKFFNEKHTLALRQFIGIGIPYGNSSSMPFIRSYYNGGSNDIRAWVAFGGLGPADSQLDERIRRYVMGNVKLTTNVEYRIPFNKMFEGAIFTDIGNIWSLKDTGFDDQFKFNKFLRQVGVGSGVGLRLNIAYITIRLDFAYKIYDPNKPEGERWRFEDFKPLKPTMNIAFGYPF